MMRNTMQVFLLARTRSLVIAMCSQQEPRRGSVVVSISFLHNHNRPSPRLDAIQCSCHQAALNRFAIFACMVFRMMRHLRCQSLLLFHFHLFYTLNALAYHNVGTCLWHVSLQTVMYQRISNKPKVTMFAVEMWFGVGDGVECGRSTGLCPLPLGVPRCVIHNKKNVGTKFLVILKKNKY